MQTWLLFFHTTFVEALIYTLPIFIVCLAVIVSLTLHSLFFSGDI